MLGPNNEEIGHKTKKQKSYLVQTDRMGMKTESQLWETIYEQILKHRKCHCRNYSNVCLTWSLSFTEEYIETVYTLALRWYFDDIFMINF